MPKPVAYQRPRSKHTWPPAGWRDRVPPAVVRAIVAVGFAGLARFDDRAGAAALSLLCVAVAVFAGLSAYAMRRSEARGTWVLTGVDVVTVLLVIPTVAFAAGIEVAHESLGGEASTFLAAAIAVVGATAVAAVTAALLSTNDPLYAALALLPAPMAVAAIIAGAERFAANAVGQGLSAVWMIAALATLADGLAGPRWRPLVPPFAFAAFALIVVAVEQDGAGVVGRTNASIAFLATIVCGALLLIVAPAASRARTFVTDALPAGDDTT